MDPSGRLRRNKSSQIGPLGVRRAAKMTQHRPKGGLPEGTRRTTNSCRFRRCAAITTASAYVLCVMWARALRVHSFLPWPHGLGMVWDGWIVMFGNGLGMFGGWFGGPLPVRSCSFFAKIVREFVGGKLRPRLCPPIPGYTLLFSPCLAMPLSPSTSPECTIFYEPFCERISAGLCLYALARLLSVRRLCASL